MPCSTPDQCHRRSGDHGERELAGALAADVAQAPEVDQSDRDREHDRASTQRGRYCSGAGEEQQHEHDDRRGRELRDLARRTGALAHRRLRQAAVHDEGAADRGRGVCRRQSEDVRVLVDALVMAHAKTARRCGALRDDDHEAGRRDRQQRQRLRASSATGSAAMEGRRRPRRRCRCRGRRSRKRRSRRCPPRPASSGTGSRGRKRRQPRMAPTTTADTPSVGTWTRGRLRRTSRN